MPLSKRRFGIEIEFGNLSPTQAVDAINTAGIKCQYEEYGHSVPSQWKIITDGTVNGVGWKYGLECVSPPLLGERGIEEVKKVARALTLTGAKVNKTCGLHVHVEIPDYTTDHIRSLILRYAANEPQIDMFVPRTRRDSLNSFCKSLTKLVRTRKFRDATDTSSVIKTYKNKYYKLNLLTYPRQGTVEFRQHSGTTNGEKISQWIRFCVGFVDSSKIELQDVSRDYVYFYDPDFMEKEQTFREEMFKREGVGKFKQVKMNLLLDSLHMSDNECFELMALSGYSMSSLRVEISKLRNCGYQIKQNNHGGYRIIRFDRNWYAPRPKEYWTPEHEINFRSWMVGQTQETLTYFEERMMEFA